MTGTRPARSVGGRGPRIQGGNLRGRRLVVAPGVRPTESRSREALFSIWCDRVPDCRFLDLFAGSGAIGLEAASRGAREVVFVEQASRVLGTLRRNLEDLAPAASKVWRWRLPKDLARNPPETIGETPFDLIFADPPYDFEEYEALLTALPPWLAPTGELAVEHSRRVELPETYASWRRTDTRKYGDACFSFYQPDSLS